MLGGPGCLVATSDGDLRTRRMGQKETPPFAGGVQFAEYHVGASSIRQPAHWFLIPLFPPASRAQRGDLIRPREGRDRWALFESSDGTSGRRGADHENDEGAAVCCAEGRTSG